MTERAGDMYECEVKALFMQDGSKVRRWKKASVATLASGAQPDIRCMHCHGRVRVHKNKVAHGPADHVEHLSRADSEGCQAGSYYDGRGHRMSANPVD
jgi:hypothetical protein